MNSMRIKSLVQRSSCFWIRPRFLALAAALCCGFVASAPAQGFIKFTASDMPDEVLGQDLWRYTYELNGFAFSTGHGFSVYFDHQLYANLHGLLPSGSSQWDVIAIQPDVFLAQPGLFDAQALVNSPSLNVTFEVRFIWLGGGGATPGAQLFEQYDSDFQTISTGTSVVPEPGSLALFGVSLLAWCGCRRMRANQTRP